MNVYLKLDTLSDYACELKGQWKQMLKEFESIRTDEAKTRAVFNSIPLSDRIEFAHVIQQIIKDWDRLSFSYLYLFSCQLINREQGVVVVDVISELNNLNSNKQTIEYACKVDLEHIDELYNNANIDGLIKLLYYSEDCDTKGYQCEYKTIAENRIKRYLNRLNSITQITSVTSTETEIQPKQEDKVQLKMSEYLYGLRGIEKFFGVCHKTAQRYRNTFLAPAIVQNGRKIMIKKSVALELYRNYKEEGYGNIK